MSDATGFIPRAYSLSPVDLIDDTEEAEEAAAIEADAHWARYCAIARTLDRDELLEVVLEALKDTPELLSHLDDACLSPYEEPDRLRAHVGEMAKLGLAVLTAIVGTVDNAVGIRMAVEALHAGGEE
jgi:hypothetical protein